VSLTHWVSTAPPGSKIGVNADLRGVTSVAPFFLSKGTVLLIHP
jgi:hypothetical protein